MLRRASLQEGVAGTGFLLNDHAALLSVVLKDANVGTDRPFKREADQTVRRVTPSVASPPAIQPIGNTSAAAATLK